VVGGAVKRRVLSPSSAVEVTRIVAEMRRELL